MAGGDVSPGHGTVKVEQCAKRLRAFAGGQLVADTVHALYV